MPPVGLGFLSWVALIPLLFFLKSEKVSTKLAVLGTGLTGFFYAFCVIWPATSLNSWWWLSSSGFFYGNKGLILFLLLIFSSFYAGAIFFIIWGLSFRKFAWSKVFSLVLFSLFWVGLEMVRVPLVFGFTWGVVGYSLHEHFFLVQIAYYFGVWGLSFLAVFSNLAIFFAIKNLNFKDGTVSASVSVLKNKGFQFFVVLVVFANFYGFWVVERGENFQEEAKAAVVYSGIKTQQSSSREVYLKYISKIEEAVDEGARFVVLPENFFPPFFIDTTTGLPLTYEHPGFDSKVLFDQLLDISNLNPETSFILGVHTRDSNREKRNSVVLLENGEIIDYYDKRRPLPFSETNFIAGDPEKNGLVSGSWEELEKIKVLICSEVIFPYLARGGQSGFIAVSSNDSVFDSPVVGEQNHIMAKFRAIESRQYLVRSVKGGVSAIFDSHGRVISSSQPDLDEGVGLIIGDIRY